RVVLPHVVLGFGRPAAEEHGAAAGSVEGGADPAARPDGESASLRPRRRPALALGKGGHEEERSEPSSQGEEKEANQGPARSMGPECREAAQEVRGKKQDDLPMLRRSSFALPSVARPSGPLPDPWLCVPTSRWVCPCREGVSALSGDIARIRP